MKKQTSPQEIIEALNLIPLPEEGGMYQETYRSPIYCTHPDHKKERSLMTLIYYLLTPDTFSALHRVCSDEIFCFYLGDCVEMFTIDHAGKGQWSKIGNNISEGELLQQLVPAGSWQGCRLADGGSFALMGTIVSPGFEFEDFELGKREQLQKEYPQHKKAITALTRIS